MKYRHDAEINVLNRIEANMKVHLTAKIGPLFLGVLFSFTGCVSSNPPSHLTQAQKLEDFDKMSDVLHKVYPADVLNKKVYGIDLDMTLNASRAAISEQETPEEFAGHIDRTLRSLKGSHLWRSDALYHFRDHPFVKRFYHDYVADDAIDINHQYTAAMNSSRQPQISIPLLYHDGNYYTKHNFTINGTKYRRGMKLLAVDGKTPQQILSTIQPYLNRFDFDRNIFYGASFGAYVEDNFYVFMNGRRDHIFKFQDGNNIITIAVADGEDVEIQRVKSFFFLERKTVRYFEDIRILYIRIPQMDESDLPFYLNAIKQNRNRPIRAVVLDVRYNPGGSGRVWMTILQALIAKEYCWSSKTAIKDTGLVKNYRARHAQVCGEAGVDGKNYQRQQLPFLDNEEFLVETDQSRLTPAPDSLKLKVPIYVIAHDVYSATGSLLTCAKAVDDIVSVGTRNPHALGNGIDPFHLSLPNSKIIISTATELDITNCKSPKDVLHSAVEIEVPMTAAERITYLNDAPSFPGLITYLWGQYEKQETMFWEDWLVNRDPYFKKVLNLLGPMNKAQ